MKVYFLGCMWSIALTDFKKLVLTWIIGSAEVQARCSGNLEVALHRICWKILALQNWAMENRLSVYSQERNKQMEEIQEEEEG